MTATIALPRRQLHSDFLARLRTVGLGLGGRGVMGLGLGRSSVQAAEASWWLAGGVAAANAIAVYQPKGAASLAASYTNLASPGTYDAAPGVAPTFDAATGWTSDGTQWLNTGILLSAGYCAIVRFSGSPTNNTFLAGYFGTGKRFELLASSGLSGVGYGYGDQARQTKAPVMISGVLALTPTAGYRNGVSDQALTGLWTGTANYGLTIFARRSDSYPGNVDGICAGNIQAVAIYNTTLTAPQVAAVSAAMAAL